MIIYNLLMGLIDIMDNWLIIEIPSLPDSAMSYLDDMMEYVAAGAGILANYTPLAYLVTLLGIIIVIDTCIGVYHLVMWIIKKVPFLGVE